MGILALRRWLLPQEGNILDMLKHKEARTQQFEDLLI